MSRFTFHVSRFTLRLRSGQAYHVLRFTPLGLLLLTLSVYADLQPVQFTDVTAEAGIHFRHVNGAKGDYHLPETIGAGGAFFDYDNDGALDLYLVNSGNWPGAPSEEPSTSVLYRNNGDGTFTDVTATAGVDNAGNYGQGVAVGDYDNDGNGDLYVTNFGPNVLYHNNGDGTFTNVTAQAGVGDPLWSSSATFFDYDRDGNLDLYVVNYVHYSLDVPYRPCGDHGIRSYCHPSLFEGAPDRFYHNNGDGTFTDVTKAAGITDIGGPFQGKGLGVVAADFNNDGNLDLYVANDDTPNYLFYNHGDGTFTEIALLAGCAYSFDGVAQAGMGVDAGDYNGDGFLDIFVTNLSYETNTLYRNNGDGTFTDVSYEAHLGQESYLFVGFGTGFFDYDNNGHPDVFIANGHVIDNIERTSDVLTYAQRNQLFHNNGDGTFTEVSFESGAYFQRKGVSRGAIFGDYDNDGDIDIVVTQSNQPAELLRNEGGNRRNWLRVKTVGTISNRDGIGARVTVTVGSQLQTQEVHTGKSYLCSHDPRLFFGLGEHTTIDRLEIRWPSGVVQVLERIPANQELVVLEEDSEDLWNGVRKNDIEAVQIALNKGANVNTTDREGRTALMVATQKGYANLARRLIQNGADVNAKNIQGSGSTALIYAANVDVARLLIENGANVDAKNNEGMTALMYAAQGGHTALAKLLIQNGADVNLQNNKGVTALIFAGAGGYINIARLLIENRADVNAKNSESNTALIVAIHATENANLARLLIENGADVNAKNSDGETALMYASWDGQTALVKLLIENGADVNAKNSQGNTALMLAESKGHIGIVRMLKNAGAQ